MTFCFSFWKKLTTLKASAVPDGRTAAVFAQILYLEMIGEDLQRRAKAGSSIKCRTN